MVLLIAEIGINHNGSVEIARKLIDVAVESGFDAVKFQKRDVETCYTEEFLTSPRESPWGNTQRNQKMGLEFTEDQYDELDFYCFEKNIPWFASAWDLKSQLFLHKYNLPYNKIASAMLTNEDLLRLVAKEGKYTFISTGMSTMEDIEKAVTIFQAENCPYELMHCVSVYNMPVEMANLNMIKTLRRKFGCNVGYSGHEQTIILACAAVAMGATSIEKHITLDHAMYGSDQSASLEPVGCKRMVEYIRAIEKSLGTGEKVVYDEEKVNARKLRYFEDLS